MNKLAKEIHEIAKSKGFWDNERNVGELLMLCVSELSEALDADRKDKFTKNILLSDIEIINSDNIYYEINDLLNDVIENDSKNGYTPISFFEEFIKDTFEDEIADTIIRLLDLCAAKNIDIETHIRLKMEYNKTRERLHGKKY